MTPRYKPAPYCNMNKIIILSDKYSQTLKTLNISLERSQFGLNVKDLNICIECIARFENLKELTLEFIS